MALINSKAREIEAKLVFYGTALGGKTTNLLVLHRLADPAQGQKLVSLNTAGDRTLFFDLLPFDLGKVLDFRVRLKLYTIPGQPEYNETRRVVLANTDGIVFVADSSPDRAAENVRLVNFLKLNCQQNQIDPNTVPLVFQYNKRDLPGAMPSAALEGDLNWRKAPYFLAVAVRGEGVLETFEEAVYQMVTRLLERFAPRGRNAAGNAVREAIREKLAPLHARRAQWEASTRVAPGGTGQHVVVLGDAARTAGAPTPAAQPGAPTGLAGGVASPGTPAERARPLDTQDLLSTALDHEMKLLNELMDRDARSAEAAASAAQGLDPARLAEALKAASEARDVETPARAFLRWALSEARLKTGSVLLLTPGDGRLGEAARACLDSDPVNALGAPGAAAMSRRLALGGSPVYGPDLVRLVHGTQAVPPAPVPAAAVPLHALGTPLGLLVLYSEAPQVLDPARRAAVEAVASVLGLVLALRALERRARDARPAEPASRPHAAPGRLAAAGG